MPRLHVQQRRRQNRAVGGNQRQVNAQRLIKQRAGFMHHHLGELHHYGDHQNEGNSTQIFQT